MSDFDDAVNEVQEEQDAQIVPSGGENEDLDSQLAELQNLAKLDPSILEDEDYKNLVALARSEKTTEKKVQGRNNVDDEEEDDDEEDETEASTNPFFSEKGKKKQKEIPIDFEVPEEFTGLIKDNFGVNDLPTFLNSVQVWRNQAQEANDLRANQEAIMADLQAMPYELKLQVEAWANGEDPLSVVKNMTRLDFSVDFSNQKIETLVQHYLPEEYDELIEAFNKEELTEAELDKQISLLGRTTRKFFDGDKQALKVQRDEYTSKIAESNKAFKNSALVSVESFSKAYPDFSKTEINKIRSTLVEGKLESIFFNPDGTYTEKAAEFVAFALNGKKILEDMERKGERKGESKQALEIVDRSPKSIKKRSQSAVDSKPDLRAVDHLRGVMVSNDPYS